MQTTTIPFSGFYQTHHEFNIDYVLYDDESTIDIDSIDFGKVRIAYAKEYLDKFSKEYEIELKYEELSSPKFYNYSTDRIFAKISTKTVNEIMLNTDSDVLESLIAEKFTHRSGFVSFYPNSLYKWPTELSKWDHNQVGTLIEAYVDMSYDDEQELMEHAICNGMIEEMIDTNTL